MSSRPALRNIVELRVPTIHPGFAEWPGLATKLATDVVAQANRQWLDFRFSGANRAMDLWWRALRKAEEWQ